MVEREFCMSDLNKNQSGLHLEEATGKEGNPLNFGNYIKYQGTGSRQKCALNCVA